MKYFLICNPGSRNGKSGKLFNKIYSMLAEAGTDFDSAVTNDLKHASILARDACHNGYDVITAVGGDGTINRVLNGFYDSEGRTISRAKLGIIYTGTSPDFCKSYGIPTELTKAVRTLISGDVKPLRCGKISYATIPEYSKTNAISYFGCCSNIGIGATLARMANNGIRKYMGDVTGTFISLLRALHSYTPISLCINRDGIEKTYSNILNLSIGKTLYIASGIKIHNNISSPEKKFYNLTVTAFSIIRTPEFLRSIYSGKPIHENDIFSFNTGSVYEINSHSHKPVEVEFDGDPAGYLPCRIEPCNDTIDLITERSCNE